MEDFYPYLKVEELVLVESEMQHLAEVQDLTRLKKLYLYSNKIQSFDGIQHLSCLEVKAVERSGSGLRESWLVGALAVGQRNTEYVPSGCSARNAQRAVPFGQSDHQDHTKSHTSEEPAVTLSVKNIHLESHGALSIWSNEGHRCWLCVGRRSAETVRGVEDSALFGYDMGTESDRALAELQDSHIVPFATLDHAGWHVPDTRDARHGDSRGNKACDLLLA